MGFLGFYSGTYVQKKIGRQYKSGVGITDF
jgi:hypothetical protein